MPDGVKMINRDFLAYNDKYTWEVMVNKHIEQKTITETDAKYIRLYITEKLAKGKIGERRAQRVSVALTQWRRFLTVEYKDLTYEDLISALMALKKGNNMYGRPYKDNTQRQMIKTLKTFVKFLIRKKVIAPIDVDDLKDISPPEETYDSISENDILTPTDINKLVESCNNSRDRAMLMLLYETGARIGEIARLTWNDLTFSKTDCRVRIEDEKTKGERFPYVVASIQYLIQYRNDRGSIDNNDFVFVQFDNGKPITYRTVTWTLERVAVKAEIKKPITPKLFRTSRITNMIKEGYPEAVIRKMMWKKQSTKMFDYYLKLADTDVQKAVLAKAGVVRESEKVAQTKPIKCVCGHLNEPTLNYCGRCGRALKEGYKSMNDEISEADRELLKLLKNPKIIEKLQKLGE